MFRLMKRYLSVTFIFILKSTFPILKVTFAAPFESAVTTPFSETEATSGFDETKPVMGRVVEPSTIRLLRSTVEAFAPVAPSDPGKVSVTFLEEKAGACTLTV